MLMIIIFIMAVVVSLKVAGLGFDHHHHDHHLYKRLYGSRDGDGQMNGRGSSAPKTPFK